MTEDPRFEAACDYVSLGWRVFVLGADKKPLGNCGDCPSHRAVDKTGERHDAEVCECLTCHGFYAGTRDLARIQLMLERHPHGLLAIRTGMASGIVVIDAESSRDNPNEPTGVEVLDDWESWVTDKNGETWTLPPTLRQRTGSGGIHLVYRLPPGMTVKSRGRVLPSVDVKAEGGYVAVPPGANREWLGDLNDVTDPSPQLLSWLQTARGSSRGRSPLGGRDGDRPGGYDFDAFVRDGCPAGQRDEFVNEFCFRLRKNGTPKELATEALRLAFEKMEQPPGNEYSWDDCLMKVSRVWDTVEDDDPNAQRQQARTATATLEPEDDTPTPPPIPDEGRNENPRVVARDVETTGTGPDNPHRVTDRANGIEIASFLKGKVIWAHGMGWLIFDGKRWQADEQKIHRLLVGEFVDGLRQQATSGVFGPNESEILMNRANRLESTSGLHSALSWTEPLLARAVADLDANPWVLNCPNGTLDLKTGELRPHAAEDLLTRITPTPYDPDARDETWERVVHEALPSEDMLRLFVRFAGYTLTGDVREKKLLVIKGQTDTGKSTVTEPLYRMLGDVGDGGYATTWDADVVQAHSRVNRAEKLSKARGARMILTSELEKGSRFAENFVKQFTGGDTMDARELYRSSYSFRPTSKLWMATNYTPTSADKALQNRLLLLPFTQVPKRKDPRVKKYLDEDERAHKAILAWTVRACLNWQREGTLGSTPWLQAELDEYALDSDPILQFLHDECESVETWDESSATKEVFGRYEFWAPQNVRNPLKPRAFDSALKEHGYVKNRGPRGKGEMRWFGLRLAGGR